MKSFSVSMALADYLPVAFFIVAAILLMRDLHNKMSKGAFALFSAGVIDIAMAGGLKATYKLLYALGICDFQPFNAVFFPVQSLGFLLAGLGVLAMLVHRQSTPQVLSVAPPLFTGTFIFVGLMITGLAILDAGLCVLAVKLKKSYLIAIFILSFVCSLGMGYLSSRNFAKASMNWIAEEVNIVGQGCLCLGVFLLHKHGLAKLELRGIEEA